MKRFLSKILAFGLPLWILGVIYCVTDVFKVIHHYDSYYNDSYYIDINRSYGSTMTYVNQNPKYDYNSFIFGNSRSIFYEVETWKKYLPNESRCMHFDESGGSICGIRDKIVFIDNNGGCINNALMVIDHSLLSNLEYKDGWYVISPPVLKHYTNLFNFHLQHFMAFLNIRFLVAIVGYRLTEEFSPYMKGYVNMNPPSFIDKYNELRFSFAEKEIADGTYYDLERIRVFENVQNPGTYSNEKIGKKGQQLLKDIKQVFDKHHTSYKIVISPLYDQVKLNRDTYKILCQIFGKDKIYDFSGVNKWNKDFHNYYEASHYRPHVAAEVMKIVYSN